VHLLIGSAAVRRRCTRLLLIVSLMLIAAYQVGVVFGQVDEGATLTVLRGTVALTRSDGSALQPATTGTVVHAGDRIATVGPAGALITFFVGAEIEMGADTTIAIQDIRGNSSGVIDVTIENVLGSTVHRVATLTNAGSSYRVVAGGTVALVRGTTFGHRHSADGTVTMFLTEASGDVFFPTETNRIYPGEACMYTPRGDLQCVNAASRRGDIWNVLAEGDKAGETNGNFNPGTSTGSNINSEQPHGLTTGPDKTAKNKEDDTQPNTNPPTPTPTPTPTLTPTATATRTPIPPSGGGGGGGGGGPSGPPADLVCTPGPATMVVNSKADNNIRDNVMTLREALMIANGTLPVSQLTAQEKAQITNGGCGGTGAADTITFDPGVFAFEVGPALARGTDGALDPNAAFFLRQPAAVTPICPGTDFPAISGDTLVGIAGKVEIACTSTTAATTGITVSGGTVMNMTVRGFTVGIGIVGGTGSLIQGNHVVGLGFGEESEDSFGIQVNAASSGNTIRGNFLGINLVGIDVDASNNNVIQGNFVGFNRPPAGGNLNAAELNANWRGIDVLGTGNMVGGFTPPPLMPGTGEGAGNLISGNALNGLTLDGPNTAVGNYIGTKVDGTVPIDGSTANGWDDSDAAVVLSGNGPVLGGTGAGAGNLIAGNFGTGVEVNGTQFLIQGNTIRENGDSDFGGHGILVSDGASGGVIGCKTGGGTVCEQQSIPPPPSPQPLTPANTTGQNIITDNARDGISVESSDCPGEGCIQNNTIRANSIYENGTNSNPGIRVGAGSQHGIQPPILDGAFVHSSTSGPPELDGRATCPVTVAPQGCIVEVFDNGEIDPENTGALVASAEARTPIGTARILPGSSEVSFTLTSPSIQQDHVLTATLTYIGTGDTSGNSNGVRVFDADAF
jgi:hypothetical protein